MGVLAGVVPKSIDAPPDILVQPSMGKIPFSADLDADNVMGGYLVPEEYARRILENVKASHKVTASVTWIDRHCDGPIGPIDIHSLSSDEHRSTEGSNRDDFGDFLRTGRIKHSSEDRPGGPVTA
jgi:hypothetical protein